MEIIFRFTACARKKRAKGKATRKNMKIHSLEEEELFRLELVFDK